MTVRVLEELSTLAIEALDRARTAIFLPVSPLEAHGPHLPVGVDVFSARSFAQVLGDRLSGARPGWTAVLAPTLPLGASAFDADGTVVLRQRVVREVIVDYGRALAGAGFRYILVVSGHAGPGHLVALEEAADVVSRRDGVLMASVTGYLAWEFLRGRYLPKLEAVLGRALTPEERLALAEDSHGGWWETSLMLLLRPDLVDDGYRALPPARYTLPQRLRPSYATRGGRAGYVGHPALADPAFAKAALEVLTAEAFHVVEDLLDARVTPARRRSPFFRVPFLRTNFWPAAGGALAVGVAWWWLTRAGRRGPSASASGEKGAQG